MKINNKGDLRGRITVLPLPLFLLLLGPILGIGLTLSSTAYALAPVVNANPVNIKTNTSPKDDGGPATTFPTEPQQSSASLPINTRINRLEQQIKNLNALPQQITELQQEVAKLNGQLEQQAHQFEALKQTTSLQQSPSPHSINNVSATTTSPQATAPSSSTPSTTPDVASSSVATTGDDLYQKAVDQLMRKDYTGAENSLHQYLKDNAKGAFVANAHYWLGELYLLNNRFDESMTEFKILLDQYPNSPKISDAQLKIAIIHAKQGHTQQAKTELNNIKKQYPGTTAARLAEIQLKELETAPHAPADMTQDSTTPPTATTQASSSDKAATKTATDTADFSSTPADDTSASPDS